MPTTLPVAMPDAFSGYNGQSLYQPSWQGVLTNDASDPNTSLSVTAVNGQSANVGSTIVLASGSSVLLYGDGSFVYTPAVDFYGLDSFEYTASDGVYSDTTTVEISSIEITLAPVANQSHIESDAVSLQVTASASSGPAIDYSYSASNLPTGLSIDTDTGLISGTIAYGAVGSWPVTVFATAPNAGSAQYSFTWAVAPVEITVAEIANQSHIESDAVSLSVSASVSHGPAIDYTYSASNLPIGLSIDTDTGLISGTIAYGAVGSWPVTAFAYPNNGSPAVGQFAFTWAVAPVEITVAEIANQAYIESDSVSLQVSASVSHGPAIDYVFSASNMPTGLSIDADTGLISGTIAYGAVGSWPVTVFAYPNNGSPAVGQYSFTWAVAPVEITIAEIANQESIEGNSVSLQVSASVSHGPAIDYVFSASNLPTGLSIDADTGLISGTISYGAVGSWPVTVFAYPNNGSPAVGQYSFTWAVAPVEITIAEIADRNNREGDTVAWQLSTTYTGSEPLTFTVTGLPPGLTMNSATGFISGTIAPDSANNGTLVDVIVTNGTTTATRSFIWTVSSAINLGNPGDQQHTQGDTVSLQITATGPGPLTYYANGLPLGLTIDEATGLITGTISNWASDGAVTVSVSNGLYSTSQNFSWRVTSPISIAPITDQVSLEGDVISLQVTATAPEGMAIIYGADNLPGGLTIDPSTGQISGTIDPNTAQVAGLAVVWAESAMASAYRQFAWTVTPRITFTPVGDQENLQGDTISLQVSASSIDGNLLTYSATALPAGLVLDSATGQITGTPEPTAVDTVVTVTATDGVYSTSHSFVWSIASPIRFSSGVDRTNKEGDAVSFSVGAMNANATTLTYSAFGLPSGLTINIATGVISGTPNAGTASHAPALILVEATDGTYTGSQRFLWTIAPRVTVAAIPNQISEEGDPISLQVLASLPDDGDLTYSATGLPQGLTIDAESGLISGTFAASTATSGNATIVTVTVTDGTYTSTQTFHWAVRIVTSDFVALSDDYRIRADGSLTVNGSLGSAANLLANDLLLSGNSLSVTAINGGSLTQAQQTFTLASGATVVADAFGNFTYQAGVGFAGLFDQFTYTLTSGAVSVIVPVVVNLQPGPVMPFMADLLKLGAFVTSNLLNAAAQNPPPLTDEQVVRKLLLEATAPPAPDNSNAVQVLMAKQAIAQSATYSAIALPILRSQLLRDLGNRTDPNNPALLNAVRRLDDEDFEVRNQAQTELRQMLTLADRKLIEKLMQANSKAVEPFHQLGKILEHLEVRDSLTAEQAKATLGVIGNGTPDSLVAFLNLLRNLTVTNANILDTIDLKLPKSGNDLADQLEEDEVRAAYRSIAETNESLDIEAINLLEKIGAEVRFNDTTGGILKAQAWQILHQAKNSRSGDINNKAAEALQRLNR